LLSLLFCWGCQLSSLQQESDQKNNISKFNLNCNKLISICESHLGYPYVWGGISVTNGGFDCSGFIYSVFKRYGKPIPRTTSKKYWLFFESPSVHWSNSKCGYLVWWTLTPDRPFGHIGIMVDSKTFWQSGTSTGPVERNFIDDRFWSSVFVGAKDSQLLN